MLKAAKLYQKIHFKRNAGYKLLSTWQTLKDLMNI